jgi:long-subunit fatty acid transport protein
MPGTAGISRVKMTKKQRFFSALACLAPVFTFAQFAPPSGEIAVFPLNPLPTSARCLGMGNACTAIADDIDMLAVNPAGVAGLEDTSFNIQARYAILETVYLDQDAVDSEYLGARPGQLYKPLKDEPADIAFAGFSKPFGRWTVSAFYQKTLGFSGSLDVEEVVDSSNDHLFTNRNAFSAALDILGASAAFQISDAWSLGVAVMAADLEIESEDSWQINSLSGNPVLETGFNTLLLGNHFQDKAGDTLLQFGLIFQPGDKFSAGLNYRQGGEYDFSSQAVQVFSRDDVTMDMSAPASSTISLPDTLSLGIAWRPTDSMLISFDIEQLGHSDLPPVRDHSLGLNLSVEQLTEPIDDTSSFKLGFEKQFASYGESGNRYAFRAGILSEEDHDGVILVEGYDTQFTAGFGASFGHMNRFKIDTGILGGDEEILFIASFNYTLR